MNTSVKPKINNGFTLIEVLLVLAVTSLLFLIAFFGQGAATRQARFRDAAESFRDQIIRAQEDVSNTTAFSDRGCSGGAVGTDADCINLGKVISFNTNPSIYRVRTLVADGPAAPDGYPDTADPAEGARVSTSSNASLRFGARFAGVDDRAIVIIRHAGTGELLTGVIQDLSDAEIVDDATYDGLTEGDVLVDQSIYIVGDGGDCAKITFNDPINTVKLDLDVRNEPGAPC